MGQRASFTATCLVLCIFLHLHAGLHAAADPRHYPSTCSGELQRISCYYDSARTAIVGVEYMLRSRQKSGICKTVGSAGDRIFIKRGVGVIKLTVTNISIRVVGLDFTLSDGRTASCRALSFSDAASSTDGRRLRSSSDELESLDATVPGAPAAAASAVATADRGSSSLSDASALVRYLRDHPTISSGSGNGSSGIDIPVNGSSTNSSSNGGKEGAECYPGCSPLVCGKRCSSMQRSVEYVGPSAAHFLAGMRGLCTSAGFYKDSLRAVLNPCWAVPVAASPSPNPVRSPSPSPLPPLPSPAAPKRSPRPPKASPSPDPLPASPIPSPQPGGIDGSLAVTLFSRGQTACAGDSLSAAAAASVVGYLRDQLLLLQLGSYSVRQAPAGACQCSMSQGTPMYACKYIVQGPTTADWDGAAAATYLSSTIAASGQEYCSSAPDTGLCGGPAQTTGFCAASPAPAEGSGPLSCYVAPDPKPWQLAVTLAQEAASCSSNRNLSDAGAASLVQYIGGLLPGFSVTLPAYNQKSLKCVSGQGNAYYQVPGLTISSATQTDVRRAAEFAADALNSQQLAPCIGTASPPAYCRDLPVPPVTCGTASYTPNSGVFQCTGAGASFSVVFSNPGDACTSNPPPVGLGESLDPWWRFQLNSFRDGKMYNATTIVPGTALQPQGTTYCNYEYRVRVTGPLSITMDMLAEMALTLMSNVINYRPTPCAIWKGMPFCDQPQFVQATMCAANPYMAEYPLQCNPNNR